MINVSIIIINYNTKKLTKECLDSVFANTYGLEFEVIVVDNGSTDGSVDFFRSDKRITFIESSKNLGFGKANNLGFKYAKGKYIFLLNSDTLLLNNAVKFFFEWMEQCDKTIACVGSLLMNKDGNIIYSYGDFPSFKNIFLDLLVYRFINKKRGIPKIESGTSFIPVDYVSGADLFIRRNVIEECGFFDPEYFLYYEETDLQYRYNLHGYKSGLIFTPKIIHLEGASSTSKRNLKKLKIHMQSRFIYCKKHFSKCEYILTRILFLLWVPIVLFSSGNWDEKKKILLLLCK